MSNAGYTPATLRSSSNGPPTWSIQQRVASPSPIPRPLSSRSHAAYYASPLSTTPALRSQFTRSHQRTASHSDGIHSGSASNGDATSFHSEWSYFGVDITVGNLSAIHKGTEESAVAVADDSQTNVHDGSSTEPLSSRELLSCSFGGNRWKVELVHHLDTQSEGESTNRLSLYLSCALDDYTENVLIPTSIMIAVREPVGSRQIVWQVWEDFTFGQEKEFWECHAFPMPAILLARESVASSDAVHLSIQLQTPNAGPFPALQHTRNVPSNLLAGLAGLLDDKKTGDVQFILYERQAKPAADNIATQPFGIGHVYRKRIIYAHSAILCARSQYFRDMLSSDWKESDGTINIIRVVDFDFIAVFWLLSWIYTHEISFMDSTHVNSREDGLSDGSILSRAGPGYEWQNLSYGSEAGLSETCSTVSGSTPTPRESRIPSRTASEMAQGRPKSQHVVPPPLSASAGLGKGTPAARRRAATPEPLGRLSPVQTMTGLPLQSPTPGSRNEDPHPHPAKPPSLPSALEMYRIAHRYDLQDLADTAALHIQSTLTPSKALPLLLATYVYPDVYTRVRAYCLDHYVLVSATPDFRQTFQEIGMGSWGPVGGDVLFDLLTSLSPTPLLP